MIGKVNRRTMFFYLAVPTIRRAGRIFLPTLVTVLPDLLLAISGLLNYRNSCLSLEK